MSTEPTSAGAEHATIHVTESPFMLSTPEPATPKADLFTGLWTADDLIALAQVLRVSKMTLGQLLDEMRAAATEPRIEP